MAKVSILFDEEHITYTVFECMHFSSDNVNAHLIEHIDNIGKQPPLIFAS